jgi:hypothetical protein
LVYKENKRNATTSAHGVDVEQTRSVVTDEYHQKSKEVYNRSKRRAQNTDIARKQIKEFIESETSAKGKKRVIVIFGDGDSRINKRRVEKAIELNKGNDFFLLCGTDKEVSSLSISLRTNNIPKDKIARLADSIDTVDNIRQVISTLKDQVSGFTLITSVFQEPRTRITFGRQMMSEHINFNIEYESAKHPDLMKGHWIRLAGEYIELGFSALIRYIPDLGIYEGFKNNFEFLANSGKRLEDKTYRSGRSIRNKLQ